MTRLLLVTSCRDQPMVNPVRLGSGFVLGRRETVRFVVRSLAILPLVLTLAFVVNPVHAATTISVKGQFVESSSKQAGCTADFCGTGFLLPLGKATDFGSRSNCLKTFTFADGSFTTCGTFLSASCSTMKSNQAHTCGVFTGVVQETVISGTGVFQGASGTLINTFTIANFDQFATGGPYSAIADYTGTVTLP